ncbi:hypothetical protein MKY34_13010 [Sporosarcina sp. FSL K6-1522]|uniref:hypothetical protein n=1 Tax=Sporosarcina sp. FSL K6-1522 TaxID=2921554 RepID=UPI00315A4A96
MGKNIGIADADNHFTSDNVEGALQELFQFADDGKKGIASVVGAPASENNTFSQLKTHIQNAKNTLATNLTEKGEESNSSEPLNALAQKVSNISSSITLPSDFFIEYHSQPYRGGEFKLVEVTKDRYYMYFGAIQDGQNTTQRLRAYDFNGNLLLNRTVYYTHYYTVGESLKGFSQYGYVIEKSGEIPYEKRVYSNNGNLLGMFNHRGISCHVYKDNTIVAFKSTATQYGTAKYDFNGNMIMDLNFDQFYAGILKDNIVHYLTESLVTFHNLDTGEKSIHIQGSYRSFKPIIDLLAMTIK